MFYFIYLENGDVYVTGYNNFGQFGMDCNINPVFCFTKIEFSNISQITTGCHHSVLLNGKTIKIIKIIR